MLAVLSSFILKSNDKSGAEGSTNTSSPGSFFKDICMRESVEQILSVLGDLVKEFVFDSSMTLVSFEAKLDRSLKSTNRESATLSGSVSFFFYILFFFKHYWNYSLVDI